MPPNVLVLVLDALRFDRVGFFGGRDLTPNIDSFAQDSTVFRNAFSTTNATDSAVTTIQTGKYPLSHGVVSHGKHVSDEEMRTVEGVDQIQEKLSDAGYRTAKFGRPLGRWHRRGFDIYPDEMEKRRAFDVEDSGDVSTKTRVKRGLDEISPVLRDTAVKTYQGVKKLKRSPEEETEDSDNSPTVTDRCLNFVENEDSFYAYVHLMDTHTPYVPDPETIRENLERFDYDVKKIDGIKRYVSDDFQDRVLEGDFPEIREKYYYDGDVPTSAVVDAHYDAAVQESDERVGRILNGLKDRDVYDDTLVFFLSDHGESLTEHGIYWDHHGLYDVSVRIPLVVRPPGGGEGEVDDLVQITDITPTIASYTSIGDIDTDGYSLKSVIDGGDSVPREYVLAEEALYQRKRMVRSENFKLIYGMGNGICRLCDVKHAPDVTFYDLVTDPEENHNVAGKLDSKVDEFREVGESRAEKHKQKARSSRIGDEVGYDDEEEVYERLEALGYK